MCAKNKLKFILSFFLVFSAIINCQGQKTKKSEIVKSFFEDIFIHNKSSEKLFVEYADKKGSGASTSKDTISDMFNKCVLQLKADRKHLLNKNVRFDVENYNTSSQPDLRYFDKKAGKRIFVVSVNGKIECYVLMKKSKILAFHYITKGKEGPTYFYTK
ncbi:hypothetical protein [Aquimarina macrocephali]|uniref:hypothetical protein n=1 Tax=Aquimarina macrocephali TaxID=666563 RepID=UPI003F6784AE